MEIVAGTTATPPNNEPALLELIRQNANFKRIQLVAKETKAEWMAYGTPSVLNNFLRRFAHRSIIYRAISCSLLHEEISDFHKRRTASQP